LVVDGREEAMREEGKSLGQTRCRKLEKLVGKKKEEPHVGVKTKESRRSREKGGKRDGEGSTMQY